MRQIETIKDLQGEGLGPVAITEDYSLIGKRRVNIGLLKRLRIRTNTKYTSAIKAAL